MSPVQKSVSFVFSGDGVRGVRYGAVHVSRRKGSEGRGRVWQIVIRVIFRHYIQNLVISPIRKEKCRSQTCNYIFNENRDRLLTTHACKKFYKAL